jgi:acetyltransferase-like isoleucine patch superfamily enzyme
MIVQSSAIINACTVEYNALNGMALVVIEMVEQVKIVVGNPARLVQETLIV